MQTLATAFTTAVAARDLAPAFDFNLPPTPATRQLAAELRSMPTVTSAAQLTAQFASLGADSLRGDTPLADFTLAYLAYVPHAETLPALLSAEPLARAASQGTAPDALAELARQRAEALAAALAPLQRCIRAIEPVFAQARDARAVRVLRSLAALAIRVALRCGQFSGDAAFAAADTVLGQLMRLLNLAGTDDARVPVRRSAVLFLANQMLRTHLAMHNTKLSPTVLKAVRSPRVRFSEFATADVVTFLFLRGKVHFYEREFLFAREDLWRALCACHVRAPGNFRCIASYFIAASLVVGVFPQPQFLTLAGLEGPYAALIYHVTKGDYVGFSAEMERHAAFHYSHRQYAILRDHLEPILLRNLLRRTVVIALEQRMPLNVRAIVVHYEDLLAACRVSFRGHDYTTWLEIEGLLASLLSQSFVKGYLAHRSRYLVLPSNIADPLPSIASVIYGKNRELMLEAPGVFRA